eukprot:6201185-Pleurochrysis_carterae.AAC.1
MSDQSTHLHCHHPGTGCIAQPRAEYPATQVVGPSRMRSRSSPCRSARPRVPLAPHGPRPWQAGRLGRGRRSGGAREAGDVRRKRCGACQVTVLIYQRVQRSILTESGVL